jgi:hypothetical protein
VVLGAVVPVGGFVVVVEAGALVVAVVEAGALVVVLVVVGADVVAAVVVEVFVLQPSKAMTRIRETIRKTIPFFM